MLYSILYIIVVSPIIAFGAFVGTIVELFYGGYVIGRQLTEEVLDEKIAKDLRGKKWNQNNLP